MFFAFLCGTCPKPIKPTALGFITRAKYCPLFRGVDGERPELVMVLQLPRTGFRLRLFDEVSDQRAIHHKVDVPIGNMFRDRP